MILKNKINFISFFRCDCEKVKKSFLIKKGTKHFYLYLYYYDLFFFWGGGSHIHKQPKVTSVLLTYLVQVNHKIHRFLYTGS